MKIALKGLSVIVILVLFAVIALFAWPLDDDALHPSARTLSFAAAAEEIAAKAEAEKADLGIRPECRSRALVHENRPGAKAVLMLHGYTDCPAQYAELAERYYDQGYNVYVPLAPRHGTVDKLAHADLTVTELTDYAGSSMDIVAALGTEAGVVGISGGGVLATWLATTRSGQVRRLLVLSPFYAPNSSQAPSFAVKPITVLFGSRIVPDRFTGGFSFAALSQYLRLSLVMDTGAKIEGLKSVAVVVSRTDGFIDLERAKEVPGEIASANGLTAATVEIPAESNIPHDVVDPAGLGALKEELYQRYFALYEDAPAGA